MFSLLRMTFLASGDADALIIPGELSTVSKCYRLVLSMRFGFSPEVCYKCVLTFSSFAWAADINTINTWAEPRNANGVTPNTIIDSNDEPPGNNQQRISIRNY